MKILKKLFVIFLTTLMTFSCFTIYASELNHKKSLVGYCVNNHDCDQYVLENGQLLADTLENINYSDDLVIGLPLTVFSDDYDQIQIYPYFYNNEVIATLEVYDICGEVGGCFSKNYVDFLNSVSCFTNNNNPLFLYRNSNGIYGIIGNETYVVETRNVLNSSLSINVSNYLSSATINCCENGSVISKARSGYGYCSWTTFEGFPNSIYYCGTQSLWNIFKNYGLNNYQSYTNVVSDYNSVYPNAYYGRQTSQDGITHFLDARGITYVENGPLATDPKYMTMLEVQTMTQTNHKYGLAFNDETNSGASKHITAIIGYLGSTSSSYYIFFDPHAPWKDTNGNPYVNKIYVDSTQKIFTSQSVTYQWIGGYLSNIDVSGYHN